MRGNGGELRGAVSPEPVLMTFSATPELRDWLRTRAVRNAIPIERQIREELEEHKRWCCKERAERNA